MFFEFEVQNRSAFLSWWIVFWTNLRINIKKLILFEKIFWFQTDWQSSTIEEIQKCACWHIININLLIIRPPDLFPHFLLLHARSNNITLEFMLEVKLAHQIKIFTVKQTTTICGKMQPNSCKGGQFTLIRQLLPFVEMIT